MYVLSSNYMGSSAYALCLINCPPSLAKSSLFFYFCYGGGGWGAISV